MVGKEGSVDQNDVVEEDCPSQRDSDQINVGSPGGFLDWFFLLHTKLL